MTEQLKMDAVVGDKFTAPLRQFRDRIREVHSGSIDSLKRLQDGFSSVTTGATVASSAVRNSLSPALQALGVTSLGVSGALAAVATSVKSFSSNTASLSLLGREVGLTADRLRMLEALGARFNLSPGQMKNAVRAVASNMYDFRRGIGETWAWLRTVEPEFAKSLGKMTNDQAVSHIISFIERIKDPIAKARAAQKLLGDESLGVLGSGAHGPIRKLVEEIEKTLGRLPASAEKTALQAQNSFAKLRESIWSLRDRIGVDLAPALTKATAGLAEWVQKNGSGISKSIREAGDWLTSQNWEKISVDVMQIAVAFRDTAIAVKDAALAISKLLGGAEPKIVPQETLKQYLVPRAEAHRRQIEKLSAERNVLALEGESDRPGSAQALARRDAIDALDAHIKRLQEDMAKAVDKGLDQGSKDGAKKLEEHTKGAWERLRSWFRTSYDDGAGVGSAGPGTGFGGLIQRASLGGMAARDIAFGSPGARGGGFFSDGGSRAPGGGMPAGAGGPATGSEASRIAAAKAAMIEQLRKEGVPENRLAEASNLLAGQALAESNLNPNQVHDRKTGYGVYGARLGRRDAMLAWLKQNGFDRNSLEGQSSYMAHEAMTGGYRRTRDALMNADPSRRAEQTHAITREFENPLVVNNRTGHVARAAGVSPRRQQDQAPAQAGEAGAALVEGGRYTSGFGMRWHPLRGGWKMHAGVDLAAKGGSAARARQDGTVVGVNGYGDVTLKYADGSTGTYRHVNANVEHGQKVSAGDTLGTLKHRGTDHRMTGPHLHYETRNKDGDLLNPRAAMDAGIVGANGVRDRMAGFADAMKSLNERSQGLTMPNFDQARSDQMMHDVRLLSAFSSGVQEIKGGADLRIKLDGFPSNTRTMTSVEGLFKNVDIDRGKQMVTGPS